MDAAAEREQVETIEEVNADLTDEPSEGVRSNALDKAEFGQEKWVLQYRERIRGRIAQMMLALLAAIVLVTLVQFGFGLITVDAAKDLVALFFTPLLGVFGAVTGFYYSASDGRGRS